MTMRYMRYRRFIHNYATCWHCIIVERRPKRVAFVCLLIISYEVIYNFAVHIYCTVVMYEGRYKMNPSLQCVICIHYVVRHFTTYHRGTVMKIG